VFYDKAYYDEFTSDRATYDVTRLVKQSVTSRYSLLPSHATVTVFGFGWIGYHVKWQKVFTGGVWGYEINPEAIRQAQKEKLGAQYELRDITKLFSPKQRTCMSVCQYVFEHISDEGVQVVCQNMVRHSPLVYVQLTNSEDENYNVDPTHCNPKTTREWGRFLSLIFKSFAYTRLWSKRTSWLYISSEFKSRLEFNRQLIVSGINQLWKTPW
jgi:hypothetical protein